MLNIKSKYQKEEFYTLVLNTCRNNLQPDILITPDCIAIPPIATKIILVKNKGQKKKIVAGFKDTYYAGATRPAGRYTGK